MEGTKAEQTARHGWIAKEQELRGQDWKGARWDKRLSMFFGFGIAVVALLCGTFLLLNDKPIAGGVAFVFAVAWLIASAVYGYKPPNPQKIGEDADDSARES